MGACSWYIVRCWTFPDMSVCTCVALATMSVLCLLCGTQGLVPGVLIVACVRHSLAADTLIGTHCVRPLCTRGKIPNCVGVCVCGYVCMRACCPPERAAKYLFTATWRHRAADIPSYLQRPPPSETPLPAGEGGHASGGNDGDNGDSPARPTAPASHPSSPLQSPLQSPRPPRTSPRRRGPRKAQSMRLRVHRDGSRGEHTHESLAAGGAATLPGPSASVLTSGSRGGGGGGVGEAGAGGGDGSGGDGGTALIRNRGSSTDSAESVDAAGLCDRSQLRRRRLAGSG